MVKNFRFVVVLLFTSLLSVSCSQNLLETRKRTHAPSSQADTGLVLNNFSPTQIEKILKEHPEAQVRVLSETHGLYEIFNVSRSAVVAGPNQQVTPNLYFANPWNPLSTPLPDGVNIESWPKCEASSSGPVASLNVTQPFANMANRTIAGKIKFAATSESRAHSLAPGPLRTAFLIQSPHSSGVKEQWISADKLDVTLEALGMYAILVAVQDSNNACAVDGVRFVITDNPLFQPTKAKATMDLAQFTHLDMIDGKRAWQVSEGEDVVVAVIDSGVSYNNPAISDNILIGANGEIGYDFVNSDAYPFDDDGHGTHVAGLVAAKDFGVARRAKILAVKALSTFGGDYASIAGAITYSVDRNAKIINLSLGGPSMHPAIESALAYAKTKGVLVVAAAGNGDGQTGIGFDIDQTPQFPASLKDDNILTVGAYDRNNLISPYSNYGAESVDIVAPGGYSNDLIYSLAYQNPSDRSVLGLAGTSMATPQVAGLAAQIWSLRPQLSALEVKKIILESGNPIAELAPYIFSASTLNSFNAVTKTKNLSN